MYKTSKIAKAVRSEKLAKKRKAVKAAIREERNAQRAAGLAAALASNEEHTLNGDVLENGTWRSAKRRPW